MDGQKFVRWETQRGCPYRCAFCQHREAGARLVSRDFAEDRVLQEIDLICAAGVDDIVVLDPIFNLGGHALRVLHRFRERCFAGKLSLQCRAEAATPRFLDGAVGLNVCLEFGLQTIHQRESDAIDRRNRMGKVDAALAGVRRRGLKHEVSLIFGLPQQTLSSFVESVAWCLVRRVPVIKAFPLMLLRGTKLDRERRRWDLVEDGETMPAVIASRTFTVDDWHAMARIAEALRRTEGQHPDIATLLRMARDVELADG